MLALGLSGTIANLAILATIQWMVLRVARKAGFRRGQAWSLVAGSMLLAVAGELLENYIVMSLDWVNRARTFTSFELAMYAVVEFVLSPFTLGVVPMLWCSFREWPSEVRAREPNVFG